MLGTKKTYFIPIIGFFAIILFGSFILCSPLCNVAELSYKDCLFISTSGVTTTGITKGPLVEQFSFFGQIILALLMEIGAMGFIIFVSYFWSVKHKKMRMSDIMVINDNISGDSYSNIKKHSIFICKYMFRVQITGIILLLFSFIPKFGLRGIWYSIFHTISAFSNTGFDIFGANSMTMFAGDIYVQLITIILMLLGSLGILVIEDIKDKGFKFKKLKLQTRIVLVYSLVLLAVPTILMKLYDPELTVMNSLFMASTSRSTGFSILPLSGFEFESKFILAVLMFIGGGPTSTSGGIRILTFAVLLSTVVATLRGKSETIIAWRTITEETVRRAFTITIVFLLVIFIGSFTILHFNDYLNMGDIVFDMISAISNTGLSLVDATQIDTVANMVFIIVMFIGRVGPLTILLSFIKNDNSDKYVKYPIENIVL